MEGGTAAASAAANDAATVTGVRQRRVGGNTNTTSTTAPRVVRTHTHTHRTGGNGTNGVPSVWTMTRGVLVPVVVITLGTFVGAVLLGKAQTLAVAALIATITSALIVRFALQLSAVAAAHPQLRRVHRLTGERAAYVRTSQRLAMMDRDFTAADYEMLLDLDNNSTRLRRFLEGASQDFIDRLPTFVYEEPCAKNSSPKKLVKNVIQSADNLLALGGSSESETSTIHGTSSATDITAAAVTDTSDTTADTSAYQRGSNPELGGESMTRCAICLEDFEAGQKIRVLPCFHRFKAGCIDPWLLEQARCPICKCNVTDF